MVLLMILWAVGICYLSYDGKFLGLMSTPKKAIAGALLRNIILTPVFGVSIITQNHYNTAIFLLAKKLTVRLHGP